MSTTVPNSLITFYSSIYFACWVCCDEPRKIFSFFQYPYGAYSYADSGGCCQFTNYNILGAKSGGNYLGDIVADRYRNEGIFQADKISVVAAQPNALKNLALALPTGWVSDRR